MNIEIDKTTKDIVLMVRAMGTEYLRPLGLEADRTGVAIPKDHPFYFMIAQSGYMSQSLRSEKQPGEKSPGLSGDNSKASNTSVRTVLIAEEGSYWDRGAMVSLPGPGLGGPPVQSMGTKEQKERFFSIFKQKERPVWAAFAMTEPQAGSDVARIATRAVKDGNEWVLNGQKMYSSNSPRAEWVVVFATVDPSLGRDGHRAFVVEANTPGFEILRVEEKMGIKAYETASFALTDCRIPEDNLLGGHEYYLNKSNKGFGGAMRTFNATRPIVSAMGVGIARAAYDVAKQFVEDEFPKHSFNRINRIKDTLSQMQQNIVFSRLLCLKAAWLLDMGKPNSFEAAQAKLFAPSLCLKVTESAKEVLGEAGLCQDRLLEKFARDVKAIDIVEGTQQIQNLVVARNLIGREIIKD